jgi:hypothetical protein
MDDTTFSIPDILPMNFHAISHRYRHVGGHLRVMSNQHGGVVREGKKKTLMG